MNIKHLDAILLLFLSYIFAVFHFEVVTVASSIIPIVFFLNLLYLVLSFAGDISSSKISANIIFNLKLAIFALVFILLIGKSFYSAVKLRHLDSSYPVHDNPIQIETAAKYLYQGKNPYSQTYPELIKNTVWKENPAVYHVVTLPFYIISSAGILWLTNFFFGWFDERIVHLIVFLPAVFLIWRQRYNLSKESYLIFLIVFFFNPFFAQFFISGRSDVFVFSWLFYCFYALLNKNNILASFFLALAFMSKQSAWPFVPFFFIYLYFLKKGKLKTRIQEIMKETYVFFIIVAVFVIPFLIWDAKGFIDGVYNYPAGVLKTSVAIAGFGFGGFLREMKLVKINGYFPFWIYQTIFCLPVFVFLIKCLKKNKSILILLQSYAIFLFVFWFFSRFFFENYIGFVIMIFLSSFLFVKPLKKT